MARRLPQVMDLKGCTIRLLNPSHQNLELVAASGLSQAYLQRGSIDAELSTHQALQGEPVMMTDAVADPRNRHGEAARSEGIASILAVPIIVNAHTIGVLRLLTARRRIFSDAEIEFAAAVAEQGGIAIQNARHLAKNQNLVIELERSEAFLQQVIDNLDADVFVLDTLLRFVMVNGRFLKNHGLHKSDVLGRSCLEILRCGDQSAGVVGRALCEQKKITVTLDVDTGTQEHFMELTVSPASIYNMEDKTDLVIGTIRDVTDRVRLENEQRTREKLQGVLEMAGAAAHELNTPVFAALGTAQLLARELKGESNQRNDMADIIRQLKQVSEMTGKMTRITRYEAKAYADDVRIIDIDKASAP
jgi:PAS domain S-box-containing protein